MSVEHSSSPPLSTEISNCRCVRNRRICWRDSNLTFKQCISVFGTILVPIVIALAAAGLSIQQQYNANQSNALQEAQASSTHMDIILADYIERITTMLDANIVQALSFDQITTSYRYILSPLTTITVRRLDLPRKRLLFLFLVETHSFARDTTKYISLAWINFDNVDLSIFSGSSLTVASFLKLNIRHGSFVGVSFNDRDINEVALDFANLNGATFRWCLLNAVSFLEGSLRNTDFTGAELHEIDFRDADLRGSNITPEQLFKDSNKLMGVAFPNGSIVPVPNLLSPKHYDSTYYCIGQKNTVEQL